MSTLDPIDIDEASEQPIALRRTKRRLSAVSPRKSDRQITHTIHTPSKKRSQKRVRFSDPQGYSTESAFGTTGLTPYLDHTSLSTPRRRASTPGGINYEEVQFTPFRQVLSERSKRRIRRNGLSHEMNEWESDKKARIALQKEIEEKDAELQRMKKELDAARQHECTTETENSFAQSRVDEVEAELETLRQSFGLDNSEPVDWSHVPVQGSPRLGSDGGDTIQIYEDETEDAANIDAADAAVMTLELETARQAKETLLNSTRNQRGVELHFKDSPLRHKQTQASMPPTPNTFYHDLSKQLKAATTRAEDAELAVRALEDEIKTLGFTEGQFNASGALSAILKAFRQARLDLERVLPGETAVGFQNDALFPEIISKLKNLAQQVRDREAELKSMHEQQRSLKGNFDHAIIVAEKASARIKELEDAIDNSAEEMLQGRMRAQALEKEVTEKDSNIASLISALSKYRDDVNRLEKLINEMEAENNSRIEEVRQSTAAEYDQHVSDLDAKVSAEERGRRAAEESAVSRLDKIKELESALSIARQQSTDVEQALTAVNDRLKSSTEQHEVDVGALNSRISNLATALSTANAEVDKLRDMNTKLEERCRKEFEQGAQAVEGMQADLIKSFVKISEKKKSYLRGAKVRQSNWEIESDDTPLEDVGPMTPASMVRFADFEDDDHVEGSVEVSRGKKARSSRGLGIRRGSRKSYDSGVGMDSLSEADEEPNYGIATPDLSSDADFEVDVETNA